MKKKSLWKNPWSYFFLINLCWVIGIFSTGYDAGIDASAVQVTQVATEAIFHLLKSFIEWVMVNALFLIIFYLVRTAASPEQKQAINEQVKEYFES